jgi:hypothetical protein
MFTIRCGDYKCFRVIYRYSYKRHEGKGLKLKICIISLQFRIMLTIRCSILYYNCEMGNKSFCILAK